jgi:hypothetical protein
MNLSKIHFFGQGSQPILQGRLFQKELAKLVKRHILGIYFLLLFIVYLIFKKLIMKINKISPKLFEKGEKPVNPISNFNKVLIILPFSPKKIN